MERFNFVVTETRSMAIGINADDYDTAKKVADNFYCDKGFTRTSYVEHETDELVANPSDSAEVDVVINEHGLVLEEKTTSLEDRIREAENILWYHNKNLTKKQEEVFQNLIDCLRNNA